jgi:hypothetical protein
MATTYKVSDDPTLLVLPVEKIDDDGITIFDDESSSTEEGPTSPVESDTDEVYDGFLQQLFLNSTTTSTMVDVDAFITTEAPTSLLEANEELWSEIINYKEEEGVNPAPRLDADGVMIFDDDKSKGNSDTSDEEYAEFLDNLENDADSFKSFVTHITCIKTDTVGKVTSMVGLTIDTSKEDIIDDRKDANFTAFLSYFNSQIMNRAESSTNNKGVDNFASIIAAQQQRRKDEEALWSEIIAGHLIKDNDDDEEILWSEIIEGMTHTQQQDLGYFWNLFSYYWDGLTEEQKTDMAARNADDLNEQPVTWGEYLGSWFGGLTEEQKIELEAKEQNDGGDDVSIKSHHSMKSHYSTNSHISTKSHRSIKSKYGEVIEQPTWGSYIGSWFGYGASEQPVHNIEPMPQKIRIVRGDNSFTTEEDSFISQCV